MRALGSPADRSLAVALALLATPGCYTTANVVAVPSLETAYPVSASSSYVSADGAIVRKDDYRAVEPFAFEQAVESPRHARTKTVLRLEPELDRLVAASKGDAITNLRIEPLDYDFGSHESAAKVSHAGWIFAIGGAGALSVGALAAANSDGDNARVGLTLGGMFAGASAACFIVAALLRQPATWRYSVTGRVVKQKRAMTSPEGVAPAPAPELVREPEPAREPAPAREPVPSAADGATPTELP